MRYELTLLENAEIEVIDGDRGKNYPHQSELQDNGFCLFLSAKNVTKTGFVFDETQYISKEKDELLNNGKLGRGDIVITTRGTIGNVALYSAKVPYDNIRINSGMLIIRCGKNISNQYLYQALRSDWFQRQIMSVQSGSAQPQLPKSHFLKMSIPLPILSIQQKIANVLQALDDKIELNSAINNNLEQQARSLFKSWFVDYNPFGNTMPSNWKNGKLKDILKLKRRSIKAGINTVLPYLPIDVIPMRTFALTDFKPNAEAQSSLLTFEKDDIIIGAMRVYFHRVVLAPCDGITRTTCFTLAPYHKEYLSFALLCCDQDSSIDYAQSTSKGSTMPYAIWEGGLGDMEIAIPTLEIAQEFNEIVLPMLRQIQNSYFENNRLREIRDGLLPRLMSGELDVSDIDL